LRRKEINRVSDRKYHYTYLITDNLNGKFYYGVHSTDYDPECIHQYHSSSKHLNSLIRNLGIENFRKEVRRYFDSREEANKWESKVLRRIDAANNEMFYNKNNNGDDFYAGGRVGVIDEEGNKFSVNVDDPYIGIYYKYLTEGRKCKHHVKKLLSDLYSGTRQGENNPVHKIKDEISWRRNIAEGTQGKGRGNKNGKWHEGLTKRPHENTQKRMNLMHSVNNKNKQHVYIYKGGLYLNPCNIPEISKSGASRANKGLIKIKENKPLTPTITVNGIGYSSLKEAAEEFDVHPNTVKARLDNEVFPEYRYIDENIISFLGEVRDRDFVVDMKNKHKSTIKRSETKDHFSQGLEDYQYKELFMNNNPFMEMYEFRRVKSENNATTFEVTCPICSKDEYVEKNLCTGKFYGILPSLLKGNLPCRCGDIRGVPKEIILYEVKMLCEREGLEYIGVNGEYIGKKCTKIKWRCKEGNVHENTTIKHFLEEGSRCKCCKNLPKKRDREKVDLGLKFKNRFDTLVSEFNERRDNDI